MLNEESFVVSSLPPPSPPLFLLSFLLLLLKIFPFPSHRLPEELTNPACPPQPLSAAGCLKLPPFFVLFFFPCPDHFPGCSTWDYHGTMEWFGMQGTFKDHISNTFHSTNIRILVVACGSLQLSLIFLFLFILLFVT